MPSVPLKLTQLERRDTPATLPTGFSETLFGEGVSSATSLTIAPNGDAWATEQGGGVKRFRSGTTTADAVFSLTVNSFGERGLLGLAFDPDFATNKYVYVYHTVPAVGTAAP